MKLTVNGERITLEREMSIADFLRTRSVSETMVGVDAAKFLATWTNAHESKLSVEQRDVLAAAMMVLRSIK